MNRRRRTRPNTRKVRKSRGLPLILLGSAALLIAASPQTSQIATNSGKAVVIPIRGEITDVMHDSIERRLELARADGATTIIFEMDTPGGMVTSALDICRLIKNLPSDVHSVAWVHHEAYSAGAMISVACQQIVMSAVSSIGDCAPIMVIPGMGLQELPPTERAKAESPVLQEFRDSAIRNGYDPLLCRAMVTVGEEVWWIEHVETGERRFVNAKDKLKLVGDDEQSETQPSSGPADLAERQWRVVETYVDPLSQDQAPAKRPVDTSEELLTLSQGEAVAYGLASGIAADLPALTEHLGLSATPVFNDISGWEMFAMWLNDPMVRGIVFMIMIVGAYMEFQSPGLIVPGAVALVALAIFLGAPYAAGLAGIWTIILLIAGLALVALEIFVIPGFGIAGVLGGALILIAFLGTFVPTEPGAPSIPFYWPDLQGTWTALKTGIIVLSSSLVIAVIGIMLLIRFLPELPGARRILLTSPQAAALALDDPYADVAHIGDIGIVVGDLRPGGTARFGTEIVDVHSQGEYVDAGIRVQVLKREGRSIVVRPLPDKA